MPRSISGRRRSLAGAASALVEFREARHAAIHERAHVVFSGRGFGYLQFLWGLLKIAVPISQFELTIHGAHVDLALSSNVLAVLGCVRNGVVTRAVVNRFGQFFL